MDTNGEDYEDLDDRAELEGTFISLKFKLLETLTETEFNKLAVAQKKRAKNMESIMKNLETMKSAFITYGTGHNRLVRIVKLNTEQIDNVDHKVRHFVDQIVDMQRLIVTVQNDSTAIKDKLHKKYLAID